MQKQLFWLFLQNIFFFPLIFFFFVFFRSLVPHILGITDTCFHLGVCFTSNLLIMSRIKKYIIGASLVAQWLRICLLMQGTRVRALVWEDPTCHGATGPVSHNC